MRKPRHLPLEVQGPSARGVGANFVECADGPAGTLNAVADRRPDEVPMGSFELSQRGQPLVFPFASVLRQAPAHGGPAVVPLQAGPRLAPNRDVDRSFRVAKVDARAEWWKVRGGARQFPGLSRICSGGPEERVAR